MIDNLRIKKCSLLIILLCPILISFNSLAQSKMEVKKAKASFEGHWYSKKTNRHLTIYFDDQTYATINDWTGTPKTGESSIDAYKAFAKDGKLVIPEDKTDLRSPYCEIIRQGNIVSYRCRAMNSRDKKLIFQENFAKIR